MFYGKSDVPYLSVEEAAKVLRMSAWTLYRNMDDVPHIMVGSTFRIPVEFLMMEPPPVKHRYLRATPRFYHQPYLPFEVTPERRWRNGKRLVRLDPFGHAL